MAAVIPFPCCAKLLIGRRSNCDVSLRFPNVSSQHCELELINGYWHVRDLGSRNGIKINGERSDSKWILPGDELSVAKHRFEIRYTPTGDQPPPPEEDPFALSLMEKAGLSRRPERREESSHRMPPPVRPVDPPSNGNDEDDQVMGWLSDD